MGIVQHHHYYLSSAVYFTALTFLVITSASAFTSQKHAAKTKKTMQENSSLEPSGHLDTRELKFHASSANEGMKHDMAQKRAIGPGSSPPSCRSKCGRCKPCRPVHVPIHPSMSFPLEYYPEAWRCKCGKKLFMP